VYSAEDLWSKALDRGGVVNFFGSTFSLPQQKIFGDLSAMQRTVDFWLQSEAIRSCFPGLSPLLVRGRKGERKAHYEPGGVIAIPLDQSWACREAVLAHEFAHHCSWLETGPTHGIAYRQAMIKVAEVAFGVEAALLLRAAYDGAGLEVSDAS
jgi:putative metallohydrolase (TIGR04338 family)